MSTNLVKTINSDPASKSSSSSGTEKSNNPLSFLTEGSDEFGSGNYSGSFSGQRNPEVATKNLLKTTSNLGTIATSDMTADVAINTQVNTLKSDIEESTSMMLGYRAKVESLAKQLKRIVGYDEMAQKYLDAIVFSNEKLLKKEAEEHPGNKVILIMVCVLACANFATNMAWNARLLQSDKPYSYFKESYVPCAVNASLSLIFIAVTLIFIKKGCSQGIAFGISASFTIITSVSGWLTYTQVPKDIELFNTGTWYAVITGLSTISVFFSLLIYNISKKK